MSKAIPENAIKSHIEESGRLQQLFRTAREFQRLESRILDCLPETLQKQVRLTAVSDRILQISVANSAVANMLRYHRQGLCQVSGASQVEARVQPSLFKQEKDDTNPEHAASRYKIDQQAASYLTDSAEYINDEKLRNALLRLASRADQTEPGRD